MSKKTKKDKRTELIIALLLNRMLLKHNNPARKTQKQIADRLKCSVALVGRAELFIYERLIEKVSVLAILIDLKK